MKINKRILNVSVGLNFIDEILNETLLFIIGRRLRMPTPSLLTPLLFASLVSSLYLASLN